MAHWDSFKMHSCSGGESTSCNLWRCGRPIPQVNMVRFYTNLTVVEAMDKQFAWRKICKSIAVLSSSRCESDVSAACETVGEASDEISALSSAESEISGASG